MDSNPIIQGSGGTIFIAILFRRPDVDHAFFSRYWREEHVRFGDLIPHARSYVQMYAHPPAPLDGVCEVAFDSVGELRSGMRDPVVAVDARRDEEVFIDHHRSYALVCSEHTVPSDVVATTA